MSAKLRYELFSGNRYFSSMDTLGPASVTKVKKLYKYALLETYLLDETPLTYASRLDVPNMVWTFIQCAKQTNSNLRTTEKISDLQEFVFDRNEKEQTALEVAILHNSLSVVKVIFHFVPLMSLISSRNPEGKRLLSLLSNPSFDHIIFDTLEEATLISVDDQQQFQHERMQIYTERIMDPTSYTNPMKSLEKLDQGELELSPQKNTVLHLVSQLGDINYVKKIIQKHPSLLYGRNYDEETPAYIAAREGHVDVFVTMINYLKKSNNNLESLLTRTTDKHTALHIAIQNHHAVIVFWLIKEVPQLAQQVNDHNESPVYLAAERKYDVILKKLLRQCREISFQGPNGKTALHAAAISGSPGCINGLLSRNKDLLYDQDKNGWTPLRYAIDHNNSSATTSLLDKDCSIGYEVVRKDGINTSLIHIAAMEGHYQTMKVLISKCPGCLEISHIKGRNILHFAIENKKSEVIKSICADKSLASLINQKDADGNTPIHLLMASDDEMMEVAMDSRVDLNTLNHEGQTPLDMITSKERRKKLLQEIAVDESSRNNKDKSIDLEAEKLNDLRILEKFYQESVEKYFKTNDNLVLVVALVATAAFAAGFTVPGGFDSNVGTKHAGMPILLRKTAFQAFVVFNSIAFASSCAVLFAYFRIQSYVVNEVRNYVEEVENIRTQLVIMFLLTSLALITMEFAFLIGVYVVVTPYLGLAISISMISVLVVSFKSIYPLNLLNSAADLGNEVLRCI